MAQASSSRDFVDVRSIKLLTPFQQKLIKKRYLELKTDNVIATELGYSPQTIRQYFYEIRIETCFWEYEKKFFLAQLTDMSAASPTG